MQGAVLFFFFFFEPISIPVLEAVGPDRSAGGTSYSERSFERAGVPWQLVVHDHRR
jgi:hypothetical protein